jgi:hypothetical protein
MFNWMIHIFPYKANLKDVFSMNDDVAHVHGGVSLGFRRGLAE